PGGLPLPAKPLPDPLLGLLQAITARLPRNWPALHLLATDRSAPSDRAGAAAPSLRLVGHARPDMGLGANLAMTAKALAAGGTASLALSADNGLEPLLGAPRPATPLRHLRRAATILHLNADRLPPALLHRRLAEATRTPAVNIGFLLWEFDQLPEAHALAVEMLDEIWAPTPFVAEAYRPAAERAGTALTVVGKAVLDGPVAPLGRPGLGLPEGAFLFLTSFDFHSSVERKNPLALVRAFQAAFPKGGRGARDVALAIKTTEVLRGHWGDPHAQWPAIEAAAAADPRIVLLKGRTDGATYRAILKAADAYVSPHRAEGFGYGPAEAMLRECPVIATDWSGTTAFCTARTAFPVPFRKVPVRPGETILPVPGASWAEIDHDALVETLRHVAGDTASRRARALAGAALMRGTYGLEAHAARLTARLDALGVLHPTAASAERAAEKRERRPQAPKRSAA
ncbi:MAG: glycosyltransferase, partial [Pseudomonadota bacterium]